MKTPEQIAVPAFKKGISGYSAAEVDEYIAAIQQDYKELYEAFTTTEEKLRIIASALSEMKAKESQVDAIINEAKEFSTALIDQAREHSETIIAKAEEKTREVNDAMTASCKETLAVYSVRYEEEKQKLVDMEKKAKEFRASLLAAYKKQLGILCSTIPESGTPPVAESTPTVEEFKADVTAKFKEKVAEIGNSEPVAASAGAQTNAQ